MKDKIYYAIPRLVQDDQNRKLWLTDEFNLVEKLCDAKKCLNDIENYFKEYIDSKKYYYYNIQRISNDCLLTEWQPRKDGYKYSKMYIIYKTHLIKKGENNGSQSN